MIKEIISTQQGLSKTTNFEQVVFISELVDEAISITGLNLKDNITIDRQYAKISPVKIDKVKILQIFVYIKNSYTYI